MRTTRKSRPGDDDPRPEYDFSGGVQGKYSARYSRGSNVVVLAPDVAKVFRTEKAVNRALRSLLSRKAGMRPRRRKRRVPRR